MIKIIATQQYLGIYVFKSIYVHSNTIKNQDTFQVFKHICVNKNHGIHPQWDFTQQYENQRSYTLLHY